MIAQRSIPRNSEIARSWPLLALSLALLIVAIAPGQARATCGDWLQPMDERHDDSSVETRADQPASPPCNGPNCRRAPIQAPIVPGTISVSPVKFAVIATTTEHTGSRHSFAACEFQLHPLSGYPQRVEHPPRHASDLN